MGFEVWLGSRGESIDLALVRSGMERKAGARIPILEIVHHNRLRAGLCEDSTQG